MSIVISSRSFGVDPSSGKTVELFTFSLDGAPCCEIMSFGASVLSFYIPRRNGAIAQPNEPQDDVLRSYDNLAPFLLEGSPFYGATTGRLSNPQSDGILDLSAQDRPEAVYALSTSVHDASRHIGPSKTSFSTKVFDGKIGTFEHGGSKVPCITFTAVSDDGEEGFPCMLNLTIIYYITVANGALRLGCEHIAKLDPKEKRLSVCDMSTQLYFNLAGTKESEYSKHSSVVNHRLAIYSSHYIPTEADGSSCGELRCVGPCKGLYINPEFDFMRDYFDLASEQSAFQYEPFKTSIPELVGNYGIENFGRPINDALAQKSEQLDTHNGFDHCFSLVKGPQRQFTTSENDPTGEKLMLAAVATCNLGTERRYLAVYTTQVGLHFYSGNEIGSCNEDARNQVKEGYAHLLTRKGPIYPARSSFFLRPEHYPDSVRNKNFPSVILSPGKDESMYSRTVYELGHL